MARARKAERCTRQGVHGPTLRYEGWGTRQERRSAAARYCAKWSNPLSMLSGAKKATHRMRFCALRESGGSCGLSASSTEVVER